MIREDDVRPRITEADIERTEVNLGIRFPDDYRAFLLQYNGGRSDRQHSVFRGRNGHGSVVDTFYGVDPAPEDSELVRTTLWEWNIDDYPMKRTLVPIGYDVFGDTLCLGVAGDELNKVFFRIMDELPEKPPTKPWAMMKGYYKVADSFTEFLSLLGPMDQDQP